MLWTPLYLLAWTTQLFQQNLQSCQLIQLSVRQMHSTTFTHSHTIRLISQAEKYRLSSCTKVWFFFLDFFLFHITDASTETIFSHLTHTETHWPAWGASLKSNRSTRHSSRAEFLLVAHTEVVSHCLKKKQKNALCSNEDAPCAEHFIKCNIW